MLTFVYIKTTIPQLPEALRVSISKVVAVGGCPFKTIAKVRREAAKRAIAAEYDLCTAEDYKAHRAMIQTAVHS